MVGVLSISGRKRKKMQGISMSETNPQKVIAAFRLGFLTSLFLDERYENGEFKRGYLWRIGSGLLNTTLAVLGGDVDPDSQRRWGRCLEAIDIALEEEQRQWAMLTTPGAMLLPPPDYFNFKPSPVPADHVRDAVKSLASPGISESGPLWNWYVGGAVLLEAMSVDRDADRDNRGLCFDAGALHLLPSELLTHSQLLRNLRQLAHPVLPLKDLGSFLPGSQGKRFDDSLVFLRTMSGAGSVASSEHSQSLGSQYGEVLALLALSLALAAQFQESLGGGEGKSGQQDEMAVVLKDIENSKDMSLVIDAAMREENPDARKKIMQSMSSGAFGKGLAMIDAAKTLLLDDPDLSVRCAACAAIGSFGREAVDYVPDLMAVALEVKGEGKGKRKNKGRFKGKDEVEVEEKVEENADEKAVRVAVVRALARIDLSGESIIGRIRDIRDLDKIIPLLASPGEAEGTLRRVLVREKARLQMGPREGYRRMPLKDIVAYVFGQCPAGDPDPEQWKDTNSKNIRNWIARATLRGMRIEDGLYDVRDDDLESRRKLHFSSPEGAKESVRFGRLGTGAELGLNPPGFSLFFYHLSCLHR